MTRAARDPIYRCHRFLAEVSALYRCFAARRALGPGYLSQMLRRRRRKAEEFKIGGYLLEQHVGAYLIPTPSCVQRPEIS